MLNTGEEPVTVAKGKPNVLAVKGKPKPQENDPGLFNILVKHHTMDTRHHIGCGRMAIVILCVYFLLPITCESSRGQYHDAS